MDICGPLGEEDQLTRVLNSLEQHLQSEPPALLLLPKEPKRMQESLEFISRS